MSLGCYTKGNGARALDYPQSQLSSSDMTTESCLSVANRAVSISPVQCMLVSEYTLLPPQIKFRQPAGECYCRVFLANGTVPATSSKCDVACSENSSETCGGPDRLNLYVAKDLESTEPC